eukprot:10275258-Lingulodinium_polyedra.AAC.1
MREALAVLAPLGRARPRKPWLTEETMAQVLHRAACRKAGAAPRAALAAALLAAAFDGWLRELEEAGSRPLAPSRA